jgi:hypothetical protein
MEPSELDRLGLLGGAKQNAPLALEKMRKQKSFADPPSTPEQNELGTPTLCRFPGSLQLSELLPSILERGQLHVDLIVLQSPCSTKALYLLLLRFTATSSQFWKTSRLRCKLPEQEGSPF